MDEDAIYIKNNILFIKPLEGPVTSRFGLRNPTTATVPKYHTGIDIGVPEGTVIVSAMEGTVELVSSIGDYGKHIKITNGEVMTLYAHCKTIYVKEGDKISQGQQIAETGSTGNVTGPHLHFEIRRNNEYVDPDLILEF
jgi:murein DD-endopeptidase MepM/ murein hydrolase activator NlpD